MSLPLRILTGNHSYKLFYPEANELILWVYLFKTQKV